MGFPVLYAEGTGIAEAWEKSLLELWEKGIPAATEYDQPGDLPSRDAAMVMVVNHPFAEPRIHLGFCGGIEDLEKYRQEIVEGVHDHWIAPEEGKWTYTYHQRLTSYGRGLPGVSGKGVDQLDYIAGKLARAPYSRRAQGITWIPAIDPPTDDPPCLQRIWCRLCPDGEGGEVLQMHTHWRSRDAYRAAFMNIYGLTELQKEITARVAARLKRPVQVGPYVDFTDSYHVYGASFHDFEKRFLNLHRQREFYHPESGRGRTLRSDDPAVLSGLEYGRQLLEREKK